MRVHLQRWLAFRRYLKRFRSVRDAPANGVVIWERYLELAAALGVAGRVEREIRAINAASSLPSPWHGAPDGFTGLTWLRHLWRHGPISMPRAMRDQQASSVT